MHQTPTTASSSLVTSSVSEYLAFVLGQEHYGIDVQNVQEIRSYERPTQLADSPAFIKGVINLRGVIVPVADLRLRFQIEVARYGALTVVIILNVKGRTVGLVVDAVSEVVALSSDEVRPMPTMSAAVGAACVRGVGTANGRMLMLVDIDKLMTEMGMNGQHALREASLATGCTT
ncbi:chemotaxis protein CheW [Herbaspirillum sp. C9C3]|uniref:chemotaxis protein CheW n=1 Tax=Herbaspirillum sp. C9C3 TaxID=2735271 RepID=UPI0015850E23|nr:chemotaxis protein CheW [Herbaspirillum sp. C9C3]NUT61401.1 chemotaxis protein CheW [Herbaspirillum sp. C9C3]